MKFHKLFKRYVPPAPLWGDDSSFDKSKILGGDQDPRTIDLVGERELALQRDNVLVTRQFNTNGWPIQRIAVAWKGPKDSVVLSCYAYVYDHLSQDWFLVGAKDLMRGELAFFDHPALADNPFASVATIGPQPIEVMLIPNEVNDSVPGEYVFVMGADCSSTP